MKIKHATFMTLAVVISFLTTTLGPALAGDPEVAVSVPEAKVKYQAIAPNRLVVSVEDNQGRSILGLTKQDFIITADGKTAKILDVTDLLENRDVGLNIVMVIDNSFSMDQRHAVTPLLSAVSEITSLVRPIDNINLVVFGERRDSENQPGGHVETFTSHNVNELNTFIRKSFYPGMTNGTYLYDAMEKGLDILADLPDRELKILVVFSDGEDLNSRMTKKDVTKAAAGLRNFVAYGVDYLEKPEMDPFLWSFTAAHNGTSRKASAATDLVPIFKDLSSAIFHRYIVTYRFIAPPTGSITTYPTEINIDEVVLIESSPLLNYIYFDTGSSTIADRYVLFSTPAETTSFDPAQLSGTMEKYHQVLNVIGRRLRDNPRAAVTLVGCNSNMGKETNNLSLSRDRAEAVASYLRTIWQIEKERITIKARNLPAVPSSASDPLGPPENQRVEILSDQPAILDTIDSTRVEKISDTRSINVTAAINAEAGIREWQMQLVADNRIVLAREGTETLPETVIFDLDLAGIDYISSIDHMGVRFQVRDKEDNVFTIDSAPTIKINYLSRREQIRRQTGEKYLERYPLILFEFDRAVVTDRHRSVLSRIIGRLEELQQPSLVVRGHTDIIGSKEYNLKLSMLRARAVANIITDTAAMPSDGIREITGVGEDLPLYANDSPEGRALNRTVVVSITYSK